MPIPNTYMTEMTKTFHEQVQKVRCSVGGNLASDMIRWRLVMMMMMLMVMMIVMMMGGNLASKMIR